MLLTALLLVPLTLLPTRPVPATPPEAVHLVRVELTAARPASDLLALGLDVAAVHPGPDLDAPGATATVDVVVTDDELTRLRSLGWRTRVLVEDLVTYYANRLAGGERGVRGDHGNWLTPPFASGSMGGYYTYVELVSVLDQIQTAYPQIVAPRVSLGQSHEGRDLWMVKVSDNPLVDEGEAEVRFDALHHAREPEGMQCSLWFLLWLVEGYGSDPAATYLVDEREIFFVPCVNPDGYVYNQQIAPGGGGMWRKNRLDSGGGIYGVDLNRNYDYQWGYDDIGSSPNPSSDLYRGPSAGSEPEIAAMMTFIQARDFATALSCHTYGGVWLSPWGFILSYPLDWPAFDEIGGLATEINGYEHGPGSIVLYVTNGSTVDYDYGVMDTLSWTPEFGNDQDGFWPAQSRIVPIAEENLLGLTRTALAAGPWVRPAALTLAEAGDGDGSYEGGEQVEVTVALRNSGLLASAGVDLSLATTSPFAEVLVGSTSVAPLASFTDGTNATPLTLRILPGTPTGEVIGVQVTVASGGWTEVLEDEVRVGVALTLASFDFEAVDDQGWTVGDPNDATTGTWTRVDPRGTAAQPEDDHTEGPGNVLCWVTGQGSVGGSLGENDVDGGSTSLWSPVFDLSGLASARLEYWRWYSNDTGGAPNADVFVVEVSNDAGQSWVEGETVGPAGPEASGGWYHAALQLETILPLTDQVRVRFIASDLGTGSVVEAAIDDVVLGTIGDGDCPAPSSYCTTSPNSVGTGALMGIAGSTGISDADFRLLATEAPPNQFGVFFFGVNPASIPFGEGVRCIAAPIHRLPVIQTDSSGLATFPVDFGAPPAAGLLQPGTAWRFQFWYRDPSGGPAGFNLSDGLEVTFCD